MVLKKGGVLFWLGLKKMSSTKGGKKVERSKSGTQKNDFFFVHKRSEKKLNCGLGTRACFNFLRVAHTPEWSCYYLLHVR